MTASNAGDPSVGPDSPRAMHAILEANVEMAHEASLTGALSGGTKLLVAAYNRILRRLREMGVLDESLFEEASPEVNMDEIGVMSKHLARFLELKFGCGRESSGGCGSGDWEGQFEGTFGEMFGKMFGGKRKPEEGE